MELSPTRCGIRCGWLHERLIIDTAAMEVGVDHGRIVRNRL